MVKRNEENVLVAGFAQLPKGTPIFELQKTIGCILIIDPVSTVIKEATFTFIQELTNTFASSLIIGYSLVDDIDKITVEVEKKLLIPPQRAAIQSIISARNRYLGIK